MEAIHAAKNKKAFKISRENLEDILKKAIYPLDEEDFEDFCLDLPEGIDTVLFSVQASALENKVYEVEDIPGGYKLSDY